MSILNSSLIIRPDHSLQDVRTKIFPFKRRKVNAPEAVPSHTLPARRKERSLSSLVVSTPRVSAQATMTGRRSRAVVRKAGALQASRVPIEKQVKKEEDSMEDHPKSSSSPETSNKLLQYTGQVKKRPACCFLYAAMIFVFRLAYMVLFPIS